MYKNINLVEHCEKLKKTFLSRNSIYKDGHVRCMQVLDILFPEGAWFQGKAGIHFFFIFMIVSKLVRFCDNITSGGHKDSIHDLAVYGMMLDNFMEQEDE